MKPQTNYLHAVRAFIGDNRQLSNDWDIVVQHNLFRGGLNVNVLAYSWLLEKYLTVKDR
jgi:hypothetical protein